MVFKDFLGFLTDSLVIFKDFQGNLGIFKEFFGIFFMVFKDFLDFLWTFLDSLGFLLFLGFLMDSSVVFKDFSGILR